MATPTTKQPVPRELTERRYDFAHPTVILEQQFPGDGPPAMRMLSELAALQMSISCLNPQELDKLIAHTEDTWTGPLGCLRVIVRLMKAEQEAATEFVRPAYWYERQPATEQEGPY